MTELSEQSLEGTIRELISVERSSLGYTVTTPVVYGDGDCVSVLVTQDGLNLLAHDASVATMMLASEGVRINRDLSVRFSAACERYGCVYENGRITRSADASEIATSVMLVANASRSVADYIVDIKRHNESQFRFAVSEQVRSIAGRRFRENEMFRGESGRSYRVPNVILDVAEALPIAFVLPLPTRNAVASQFRELYDLHIKWPRVTNNSIYDESGDFRPGEDGWALTQVGRLTPYSQASVSLQSIVEFHQ